MKVAPSAPLEPEHAADEARAEYDISSMCEAGGGISRCRRSHDIRSQGGPCNVEGARGRGQKALQKGNGETHQPPRRAHVGVGNLTARVERPMKQTARGGDLEFCADASFGRPPRLCVWVGGCQARPTSTNLRKVSDVALIATKVVGFFAALGRLPIVGFLFADRRVISLIPAPTADAWRCAPRSTTLRSYRLLWCAHLPLATPRSAPSKLLQTGRTRVPLSANSLHVRQMRKFPPPRHYQARRCRPWLGTSRRHSV